MDKILQQNTLKGTTFFATIGIELIYLNCLFKDLGIEFNLAEYTDLSSKSSFLGTNSHNSLAIWALGRKNLEVITYFAKTNQGHQKIKHFCKQKPPTYVFFLNSIMIKVQLVIRRIFIILK